MERGPAQLIFNYSHGRDTNVTIFGRATVKCQDRCDKRPPLPEDTTPDADPYGGQPGGGGDPGGKP
jgi:hypothetical protein